MGLEEEYDERIDVSLVDVTSPLAGSAVLTYVDNSAGQADNFSQGNSPNTYGPLSIGTAFANRRVLACILQGDSYDAPVTGVAISGATGGTTFSTFAGPGNAPAGGASSFSGQITWAWADVPTGTTANVVVTGGSASGNGNVLVVIYTFDKTLVINGAPTTSSGTAGPTATSGSVTVNTGASGFVIAAALNSYLGNGGGAGATGLSITSSTETYATDRYGAHGSALSSEHLVSSKKSGSAANTPTSVTYGWTTSDQILASLLAWN
jgi:hypothetical protein